MKLVLVVGPSGSGKDSLLRAARNFFGEDGKISFVRRYITRPPDANEDNYYIDPRGFSLLQKVDFFISTWQAHGNHYGIPVHALVSGNDRELMLVSISRSAVVDFEERHGDVVTVVVTADEEVLRARLQRRGRENDREIGRRLARAGQQVVARKLITFDNSWDLKRSTADFIELVAGLAAKGEYAL